jgi:hypothetical protein
VELVTDPVRQASLDDQRWLALSATPGEPVPVEELPLSLPLVDMVGADTPAVGLRNTVLVASQHLLGSTLPLIDWLHRWGLPYEQMFVCGKTYSSHRLVMWRLSELGVTVDPNSLKLDLSELMAPAFSYDLRFESDVRATLELASAALGRLGDGAEAPRQLLVLDDGAVVIHRLVAEPHLACGARVVAVEQTRRGARMIQNATRRGLFFPIVNVAESRPKLGEESALIGQSVVDELLIRLQRIEGPSASLRSRRMLIVGYGSVGRAVARALEGHGPIVATTDIDAAALGCAAADGLETVTTIENRGEVDIIVGCTGVPILGIGQALRPRARIYLASASSSDIEFEKDPGVRLKERLSPAPEIGDSDHQRIHSDLVYGDDGAEVVILNGGFPVNFNGALDPIPARHIQLTRALLLSGLRQALECTAPGLVAFDRTSAQRIAGRYKQLSSVA